MLENKTPLKVKVDTEIVLTSLSQDMALKLFELVEIIEKGFQGGFLGQRPLILFLILKTIYKSV
jgi:hypothetical protein